VLGVVQVGAAPSFLKGGVCMTYTTLLKQQVKGFFIVGPAIATIYIVSTCFCFREPIVFTEDVVRTFVGAVMGYVFGVPLLQYIMFKKGWEGF
jgi:hypothetical protein